MIKIELIVGRRSELIPAIQLQKNLTNHDSNWECQIIHTGEQTSDELGRDLITEMEAGPVILLKEDGYPHGIPGLAELLIGLDEYWLRTRPALAILMGQSRSCLAAGLVAQEKGIVTLNLDAGLRTLDSGVDQRSIHAALDRLTHYQSPASEEANINLIREGFDTSELQDMGSLRADVLFANLGFAEDSLVLDHFGLEQGQYILASVHRPETLRDEGFMQTFIYLLEDMSRKVPVMFILHPEAQHIIEDFTSLDDDHEGRLEFISSQPYRNLLKLLKHAALVVTDSEGLQEESSILGISCITVGSLSNRLSTFTRGTNTHGGRSVAQIREAIESVLEGDSREAAPSPGWDGKSGQRLALFISELLKDADKLD